jgi:hypothetical protein
MWNALKNIQHGMYNIRSTTTDVVKVLVDSQNGMHDIQSVQACQPTEDAAEVATTKH